MSQVNFFIHPEEIDIFEICSENCVILKDCFFQNDKPKSIHVQETLNYDLFTLIPKALFEKYKPEEIEEGPFKGQFSYGHFKAPSISFSKSFFSSDGVLVSGRIYAKIGWLDDKDDNKIFKSAYSKIERWIKKRYIKIRSSWWVSPKIEKWSDQGGFLALGSTLAYKTTTQKEKA